MSMSFRAINTTSNAIAWLIELTEEGKMLLTIPAFNVNLSPPNFHASENITSFSIQSGIVDW